MPSNYPPENLSPDQLHSILTQIKDYQTNHGSLLKVIGSETPHSVQLQPVSASVFPTLFPRRLFNQAVDGLQLIYNELYCKLAEDVEWLYAVTGPLRRSEPFVDALWSVYEDVQRRRQDEEKQYIEQRVHAGVFRSDYMLHVQSDSAADSDDDEDEHWTHNLCLKQVEFNSYSCAGGCHADKVADMHQFLARRGVYDFVSTSSEDQEENTKILPSSLPKNSTINGIASLLASAHKTYGPKPYSLTASHTAVLMVVQPNNFNIADERPIEYALWSWADDNDDPIPTYRIEWQQVLRNTQLTPTGELLFFPPEIGDSTGLRPVEVSVIYHRAGYEPHEYSEEVNGREIRTRLELSRAIKCPSILGHITTIKSVQQALTVPGALERWLTKEKAGRIRGTFVEIRSLDDYISSKNSEEDEDLAENYILKPASLEGGGHNIYGADILAFLKTLTQDSEKSAYILMQKIRSPLNVYGMLMSSSRGVVADEVVSELGVFGGCLWESKESSSSSEADRCQVIENRVVGWSFKTKEISVDEMSVVKGYGCFDTPYLVD